MKKIRSFFEQYMFSLRITYRTSRKYCILQFILSVALSILPFLSIYIWSEIINTLISQTIANKLQHLIAYFLIYALIYVLSTLLKKATRFVSFRFTDRVSVYIENLLIDKYKDVDLAFFDSSDRADKLSYINSIKYSMVSLSQSGVDTMECVLTLIYSFIMLSMINFWFAIAILVVFIPIIICKMKSNKLKLHFDEDSSVLNRRSEYFKSQFKQKNSITDIKLYGLKDYFTEKHEIAWKELYDKKKKHTVSNTILLSIELLISNIASCVLLYATLIKRLSEHTLLIGDATYYISVYAQFNNAMNNLIDILIYMEYSYKNMSTVREFLQMMPDVPRKGDIVPTYQKSIEFSHVSFKYPGSDRYVLKDCSFTIKSGEVIGLVGENGSGKSTIVKLLLRLYDVTEGKILIDGIDIRECDIKKYREFFNPLFQDYVQYSLSLRENVALSDWENLYNDEAIIAALNQSDMLQVIQSYENGLDSELTRRFEKDGKELSGGQWQRIALARVFFALRDFIVLDEPSAALDVFAEETVFGQFKKMENRHSLLIISHRLSSVVDSDKILVVKDGTIIEQGTHAALLNKSNGFYSGLFKAQAEKYQVSNC